MCPFPIVVIAKRSQVQWQQDHMYLLQIYGFTCYSVSAHVFLLVTRIGALDTLV